MAAYLIVQVKIVREQGWPDYRAAVGPLAERFGGRYLVRGADVEVLEGAANERRLAVFEFPSVAAIHSFWQSPEYAEVKRLREGAAELEVWAVPGV